MIAWGTALIDAIFGNATQQFHVCRWVPAFGLRYLGRQLNNNLNYYKNVIFY
jgi:hypothetical protein